MASALAASGPGAEPTGSWWRQAGSHVGGGLAGGLALGGVLAGLTALLGASPWSRAIGSLVLAGVAIVLSLPRFAPGRGVGTQWQVPRGQRLRRWGRGVTMAVWGALLGAGVLTVAPHALVLLLPALAIAAGSPLLAVIAGGTFGASRALLAVASSRLTGDAYAALDLLEPLRHRLSRAGAILAPALGLLIVLAVLA